MGKTVRLHSTQQVTLGHSWALGFLSLPPDIRASLLKRRFQLGPPGFLWVSPLLHFPPHIECVVLSS